MMKYRIPRHHSSEIPNCADSSMVEEILGSTFCKVSVGLGLVLDGLTAYPLLPHRTEVLQDPNRHFLLLLKYLPDANLLPLRLDFRIWIMLINSSILGSTQTITMQVPPTWTSCSTRASSLQNLAYSVLLANNKDLFSFWGSRICAI